MNADRAARRFFWCWLAGSAAVSTLGTVTHAVLGAAPSPVIASAVAFSTVAIQLAATYGVHALAQAGLVGAAYRSALCIAIALAALAFVVNFVQLRDLVTTWAAIPPVIAWIVPLIVDLGMTGSIIALLALTNAQRGAQGATAENHSAAEVHVEVHNTVHTETHAAAHSVEQPAHSGAHLAIAERIVAQGVVRIAPERVAQVLDAHAAGTAPSTIQRSLKVGYSTVQRIIDYRPQETA
ncbi:hypothetical protein FPV58_22035 [Mycolicibacterium porcinum]|uniref:hypothetical protein n=1 Tax=Mycolicibacterium porcinum TaxID=39693 RepID=UPI0011965175|nr:hypothetical protein [Mycolicibacterium porcinum]TVX97856.1 hypothetical protein FPV58_22035 [Mycolicibacterium porcinum]